MQESSSHPPLLRLQHHRKSLSPPVLSPQWNSSVVCLTDWWAISSRTTTGGSGLLYSLFSLIRTCEKNFSERKRKKRLLKNSRKMRHSRIFGCEMQALGHVSGVLLRVSSVYAGLRRTFTPATTMMCH